MFSCTVRWSWSAGRCGAMPSVPVSITVPVVGVSVPVIMLRSVVFPDPVTPIIPMSSPFTMERLTVLSTFLVPYCAFAFESVISVVCC